MILEIIQKHVPLHKVASTKGGEWCGPCPVCGGKDRFRVWPEEGERGRFWCRQCGKSGDAASFLMWVEHYPYIEACRELNVIPKRTRRLTGSNGEWRRRNDLVVVDLAQPVHPPAASMASVHESASPQTTEGSDPSPEIGVNVADRLKETSETMAAPLHGVETGAPPNLRPFCLGVECSRYSDGFCWHGRERTYRNIQVMQSCPRENQPQPLPCATCEHHHNGWCRNIPGSDGYNTSFIVRCDGLVPVLLEPLASSTINLSDPAESANRVSNELLRLRLEEYRCRDCSQMATNHEGYQCREAGTAIHGVEFYCHRYLENGFQADPVQRAGG